MQTKLPDTLLATNEGLDADRVLRKCVHCGFCLATCPTYQILGDELDSPRGRIYLMKDILEGAPVTKSTQLHLDRCLTCQACETTCPSGVEYHELLNIGRTLVAKKNPRPLREKLLRGLLSTVLPRRKVFNFMLASGRFFRPILPKAMQQSIPVKPVMHTASQKAGTHANKVILFQGCVQPGLAPGINRAAETILDKCGVESITIKAELCCGAVNHHLDAQEKARTTAKRNIDLWWPYIKPSDDENKTTGARVDAIVITASGCGNFAKDYANLLKHDPEYAEKANRASQLIKDVSEVLDGQKLSSLINKPDAPIAFHSPCTLQHGLKLAGVVEKLLLQMGFTLQPVTDAHLCCGSAGTYSILQKDLSMTLRKRKLENLERGNPATIATANIGCLMHLKSGTNTSVRHWLELVADYLK